MAGRARLERTVNRRLNHCFLADGVGCRAERVSQSVRLTATTTDNVESLIDIVESRESGTNRPPRDQSPEAPDPRDDAGGCLRRRCSPRSPPLSNDFSLTRSPNLRPVQAHRCRSRGPSVARGPARPDGHRSSGSRNFGATAGGPLSVESQAVSDRAEHQIDRGPSSHFGSRASLCLRRHDPRRRRVPLVEVMAQER